MNNCDVILNQENIMCYLVKPRRAGGCWPEVNNISYNLEVFFSALTHT